MSGNKAFFFGFIGLLGTKDKSDDQPVESKSLGKNQNEDHTDEKSRLLSSGTNTNVTNNSNGHTSGKTAESDGKTSSETGETVEVGVSGVFDLGGGNDRDNQTVDSNHTSHNNGDHRFHHKVRLVDTHGTDTDATLSGSICGTDACEKGRGGERGIGVFGLVRIWAGSERARGWVGAGGGGSEGGREEIIELRHTFSTSS